MLRSLDSFASMLFGSARFVNVVCVVSIDGERIGRATTLFNNITKNSFALLFRVGLPITLVHSAICSFGMTAFCGMGDAGGWVKGCIAVDGFGV